MLSLLAFETPTIDYHAFAPEIVLVGTLVALILVDVVGRETSRWAASSLAGIGILAALVPVATLAYDGVVRSLFDGAYVVDDYALVFKALFLVSGYVVVLLSTNYIAEGDYWEGEYYQLLVASLLGMLVMASARDLISMFIALELLSIPAYMLAAWRRRDSSEEAGIKYYLMGVFASAILLYGMSLLYGLTGSTRLADVAQAVAGDPTPIAVLAVAFSVIGFGFKISAVPFHTWAPDVYEGAPTPVTAFLAVASKAAGFVALITLVLVAFPTRTDVTEPLIWALAALTMVVGNLIALRQTNLVRMLAYSGIAQAGYIMAPLAVAGLSPDGFSAAAQSMATYLVIYMAMNLGAFAVVIAVARKTGSAEIDSYGGLFQYAPGLAVAMTVFMFSLAGIPPLAGWYAKLAVLQALVNSGAVSGYALAVLVGLNSVVALFYYARVTRVMWADPAPDGDHTPIRVPVSITAALTITVVLTVVVGIVPQALTHFTGAQDLLTLGLGG
jgi:NADH-quinone oxidoreductase subunit N